MSKVTKLSKLVKTTFLDNKKLSFLSKTNRKSLIERLKIVPSFK